MLTFFTRPAPPHPSAVVSSHALCSRPSPGGGGSGQFSRCAPSPDVTLLECGETVPAGDSAGARPTAAGRLRPPSAVELAGGGAGGRGAGHLQQHTPGGGSAFTRQPGGLKTTGHLSPSQTIATTAMVSVSTNHPTSTYSRCLKDNPTLRLENTIRRLKSDVHSMRAVESQLRGQLTHLESESLASRQSLSEQRQTNEALVSRIGKLTSRGRGERASLVSLEQSLVEEKRLRAAVHEQVVALQAQLSPPGNPMASRESGSVPTRDLMSLAVGAEKAVQTNTTSENASSMVLTSLGETVVGPRHWPVNQPDRVLRENENDCCQRRRLLEAELRSVCQQRRQQQNQRLTIDHQTASALPLVGHASTRPRVKPAGKASAVASGSGAGAGAGGSEELLSGVALGPGQASLTLSPSPGKKSQTECQQIRLEKYIQLASEEQARLESRLKEENWTKQQLLTWFHNSVGDINSLTDTLKQRDSQIGELSQKVEQYERYLSTVETGRRVTAVGSRPAGARHPPPIGMWNPSPTPSSSLPSLAPSARQESPLLGRPASFTSTDVCQLPLLSPAVASSSSSPFSLAVNGPTSTVSTGYSPEDLSFLLQPTSAGSLTSMCNLTGQSSTAACTYTSAGYLAPSSSSTTGLCSNGGRGDPFADLHFNMGCGNGQTRGDLLASGGPALRPGSPTTSLVVGKGRRALQLCQGGLVGEVPADGFPSGELL